MSTKDQILSSELHGEALLTARRPELQPLIDHLREVTQGRDDIRIECAGILAGSWFSSGARRGEELIAAGLLMLAGPVDLEERPSSVTEASPTEDFKRSSEDVAPGQGEPAEEVVDSSHIHAPQRTMPASQPLSWRKPWLVARISGLARGVSLP
jgi:hypothetical protein